MRRESFPRVVPALHEDEGFIHARNEEYTANSSIASSRATHEVLARALIAHRVQQPLGNRSNLRWLLSVETEAEAPSNLLHVSKCRIQHSRWFDFLDCRACRAAAA